MKIYRYALTSKDRYVTPVYRRRHTSNFRYMPSSLLTVCHQVRHEALHLFFELNAFRFKDASQAYYLDMLSSPAKLAIKDIFFDFDLLSEVSVQQLQSPVSSLRLNRFPNLRKLTLRDDDNEYGSSLSIDPKTPIYNYFGLQGMDTLPKSLDVITVLGPKQVPATTSWGYESGYESDDGLTNFERQQMEAANLEGARTRTH